MLNTLGKEDSPLEPYRQGFFPRSGDSEKEGVAFEHPYSGKVRFKLLILKYINKARS